MEVHHHSYIKEKKWKHYLWEFFMLFLAVFCGFLAEWQLELTIEHQREKQFIRSLTEDIRRDTLLVKRYMKLNKRVLEYCDSVQSCIRDSAIFKNSNSFYNYTSELARFTRYYPTDRTIQQLKNAGNMRLIRNWDVSNAITDYDSQTKFLAELDRQLNEEIIKYRQYITGFLDLSSYDKLNPVGSFMDDSERTQGNPGYITRDPALVKMIYNHVFSLKMFLNAVEISAEKLIVSGRQLLEFLQREYHLKDK